jgi:hypothetical protein
MDWRLIQTVGQEFWRRLPERAQRLHEYLVQYLRVTPLVTDLSYRLLRGWRTLHHLGQLAAAHAEAECFGTKLAHHAEAYNRLRRDVQATHLRPAVVGDDVKSPCVTQRTRPGAVAPFSTELTAEEQRQISSVFSTAWREAQKTGDDWPYGTPPPSLATLQARRPRAPTAAKSRRIVTAHSSRSSS